MNFIFFSSAWGIAIGGEGWGAHPSYMDPGRAGRGLRGGRVGYLVAMNEVLFHARDESGKTCLTETWVRLGRTGSGTNTERGVMSFLTRTRQTRLGSYRARSLAPPPTARPCAAWPLVPSRPSSTLPPLHVHPLASSAARYPPITEVVPLSPHRPTAPPSNPYTHSFSSPPPPRQPQIQTRHRALPPQPPLIHCRSDGGATVVARHRPHYLSSATTFLPVFTAIAPTHPLPSSPTPNRTHSRETRTREEEDCAKGWAEQLWVTH
jgi:hypothetical protein